MLQKYLVIRWEVQMNTFSAIAQLNVDIEIEKLLTVQSFFEPNLSFINFTNSFLLIGRETFEVPKLENIYDKYDYNL